MERDDIAIYIVVAAIIALLLGVLAVWFYAEIACNSRGCTGGGGPGNEPEASTAPFGETHAVTERSAHQPGHDFNEVSVRIAEQGVTVVYTNVVRWLDDRLQLVLVSGMPSLHFLLTF